MSTTEQMSGVELIAAERRRQVERWTPEHDDAHVDGSLLDLAQMLLEAVRGDFGPDDVEPDPDSWVAGYARHALTKHQIPTARLRIAGALIAAEIDRLQREEGRDHD